MPPHESSRLAPYQKSINLPSICGDCFELRMTNVLPLELSRPPPSSKFDRTAMLLRHTANLAMHWVKKWLRLWQNFSGALMKAILMSIAKGTCRVVSATPLEKAKRPLEEEQLGRGESKIKDREALNCEVDHQRNLILNSCSQEEVESLIDYGYFGGCSEKVLKGTTGAKLDNMHLEDNTALCLMHYSISLDFENDWGHSSDEDVGMEGAPCLETFPQKSLEGYCPQEFAKRPDAGGHYEEKERGPGSALGDFGASENTPKGDSWQSLESPPISQERREGVEFSRDFMVPEEQSMERSPDFSKDGECLSQYGKAKDNLGTSTITSSFNSPLVLSLFYSPSEEDDDDDTSEDWSSGDEMEETSQSYLDGAVLGNVDIASAAEDNPQHHGFPENLCGSFSSSMDPLHSFCFSKPIQPPTFSPPEPKNHKEITISFYLKKTDSKPERVHNSPKPLPHKDSRSAPERLPHRCCQLQTERNCDLVTTETTAVSQKESQMVKKTNTTTHLNHGDTCVICRHPQQQSGTRVYTVQVRFSPTVTVHRLVVWDYASRAARRGLWEQMARDRSRFRRRIAEVGAILGPCLEPEHRAKAWRKIQEALSLLPLENNKLYTLAGQDMLCV